MWTVRTEDGDCVWLTGERAGVHLLFSVSDGKVVQQLRLDHQAPTVGIATRCGRRVVAVYVDGSFDVVLQYGRMRLVLDGGVRGRLTRGWFRTRLTLHHGDEKLLTLTRWTLDDLDDPLVDVLDQVESVESRAVLRERKSAAAWPAAAGTVTPPISRRIDVDALRERTLTFSPDPRYPLWLRADDRGVRHFLRLNPTFPDDPLYSLLVDEDETVDFDDLPPTWTRLGPLTLSVHCDQYPSRFPGRGMRTTPLAGRVRKLGYDSDTWTTLYECVVCYTAWEESFTETGHGEVPYVQRLGSVDDAPA